MAKRPLGIAFISALAMPPVAMVEMAAELGCSHVSMGLAPMTANPFDYPPWSLRDDADLRGELRAALAATGVALAVGEVFLIRPGAEARESEADMALFAELGAARINIVSLEPDAARGRDQLGQLIALADAHGLSASLEFMPGMPLGTMEAALEQVAHFGAERLQLVVDCMHLCRSGGSPTDLAACPPEALAEVQLCDVPLVPEIDSYGSESLHHRLLPGDGELPLAEILRAIPQTAALTLEVPMLGPATAGVPLAKTLARGLAQSQALLASV